jgi:hypothetical protein
MYKEEIHFTEPEIYILDVEEKRIFELFFSSLLTSPRLSFFVFVKEEAEKCEIYFLIKY